MRDGEHVSQIALIVGSQGDAESLTPLLASLPGDLPAPLVIACPQPVDELPALAAALQEHTGLRVQPATSRTSLVPGTVYLVSLATRVTFGPDELDLVETSTRGEASPIEDLLTRAAGAYGEGVIMVSLDRADHDAAVAARAVKAVGGLVIALSEPPSAEPDGLLVMPPSLVDIIVVQDGIGPLLHDLLSRTPEPGEPEEERALRLLLAQIRERSGIDFAAYKEPTIMRRLQRHMAATGVRRLADYPRYLQDHPDEYRRLVSSFLIKATEFFRDAELFNYLREQLLPSLIARARERGSELRLWSAGCATGEEAYSLAILILELLEGAEPLNVRIFATDLDADAVAFARHGVYSGAALSGMPAELVERYFTQLGSRFEVRKAVRSLVIFGQHDLAQRAPFPRIDLALCRNVLIYFTTELQRRALQLFAFSLRPGGYLILGKSETPRPLAEFFTLDEPRLKVYRRQGERVLIPPARIRDTTPLLPYRPTPTRPLATGLELARLQRESRRSRSVRERAERLLLHLPLGVVVVDHRYDIQAINTAARQLLHIHGPAVGEDLVHLASYLPARPLRAAIDAAFRGETTVETHSVMLPDGGTPERRHLELRIYPHRDDAESESVSAVVVTVSDCTSLTRERDELQASRDRLQADAEQARLAVEALTAANRQLQAASLELTTHNAELRSTNDDLLVANEEVQAATEEIETLNEELQASNEELETLNEELQSTIEELNTTNDDLQARSVELQELAVSLEQQRVQAEAERARVEAVLLSMADAVLVVDARGHVVQSNAAYATMFGDPAAAFTPLDENGELLPREAWPRERARHGETFTQSFTLTGAAGERRWYEASGRPIAGGRPARGVVVIRDITDRGLQRLQAEFMAIASHELRTPLTALGGYMQLIQRRLGQADSAADLQRYVELARRQLGRLQALVDELVDVGRLQGGKLTLQRARLDLCALLGAIVEEARLLSPAPPIALECSVDAVWIDGDAARLEQVILNLLTNAAKFAADSERVVVRLATADGTAAIEVQDGGPGIPAADLPHIFSRFYQATGGDGAVRGLGLGLYIAREIALAHDGTLDVVSEEGRGATFTLRLPLAPASGAADAAARPA